MLGFYQHVENLVMCSILLTSRDFDIVSCCAGNQQHSSNHTCIARIVNYMFTSRWITCYVPAEFKPRTQSLYVGTLIIYYCVKAERDRIHKEEKDHCLDMNVPSHPFLNKTLKTSSFIIINANEISEVVMYQIYNTNILCAV